MLTFSLIIVLVLDRILPVLQSYRKNLPLSRYFHWVEKNFLFKRLPPRLTPLVLILPAILLVALMSVFFKVGLLAFLFYTFVAFLCLEPQVLNEDVDTWLRELARDDTIATQSTDVLFSRANRSLYTVIFWLVTVGPIMAVAYRIFEKLCSERNLPTSETWKSDVTKVVAWLEWFPALISSFLFLIVGNFDAGLTQTRKMPLFDANLPSLNESRLQQVGKAALRNNDSEDIQHKDEFIRQSRGLLLRTLVLWLALAALLEYWL
jgi:membrane protein required for beta-lactamase induction